MQISDAEWLVMNVVWATPGIEAAEVISQLAKDNGWSDATIKTMLHRLVKKGALRAEVEGKKYRYRAAVRQNDCVRRASRSFVERVFGGDSVPALLHFIQQAKLSPEEARTISQLLDQKASELEAKQASKEDAEDE